MRVALPASSGTAHAIAEVLGKGAVVFLYSGCGAVAPTHCAVDHVKATLPLVQPQLEVGAATSREILRPPLDVEDAIRCRATYRCEYAEPAVDQIEVLPVREDSVVVVVPRQALGAEAGIGGCELRIAIGR